MTTDADATRRAAEAKAVADRAAADQAEAAKAADAQAAATRAAAAKAAAAKAADKAARAKAAADAKAKAAAALWTVTKVVDGDTIWVARDGISRKVRLIGIDTPESGQCGFTESTRNLRGIIGGQRVRLTAGAQDDIDQYGRLLRYVDVNGVDAGLRQIKKGQAVARYDSRDGYGTHARETAYVSADAASPKAACAEPQLGRHLGRRLHRRGLGSRVAVGRRQVPVPAVATRQGQRGLDDRPRAGRPLLRRDQPRAVLHLDELGDRGRLPPRQGLTAPDSRDHVTVPQGQVPRGPSVGRASSQSISRTQAVPMSTKPTRR